MLPGFSRRTRWWGTVAVCLLGATLRATPYLAGFDPVVLLPPPPALGEPEDRADRRATAAVHAIRTAADETRGRAEAHVTVFDFAAVIGPGFQPGRRPRTAALFAAVECEAKAVIERAKATWRRPRPRVDDPALVEAAGDPAKSPGYPSGHATRGALYALLLAELFPARRDALLARGREIGWTRVTLGVHTPLDIQAGRVLGQGLAQALLADPGFRADLAAAGRECQDLLPPASGVPVTSS